MSFIWSLQWDAGSCSFPQIMPDAHPRACPQSIHSDAQNSLSATIKCTLKFIYHYLCGAQPCVEVHPADQGRSCGPCFPSKDPMYMSG